MRALLSTVRGAQIITLLAGAWLVIAPFVLNFTDLNQYMWDSIIVGAAVALASVWRLVRHGAHSWLGTLTLVLGLWMIVSPFIMAATSSIGATWSGVIAGIITAFFGATSVATTTETARRPAQRTFGS